MANEQEIKLKPGETLTLFLQGGPEILRVHALEPEPAPEPERCFGCGLTLGSAIYKRWSTIEKKWIRVCILCYKDTDLTSIDAYKLGFERGEANKEARYQQGLQDGQEIQGGRI